MLTSIKQRNSNLELYRILVMFMIVCHHYVVNSGLCDVMGGANSSSITSDFYYIFGAWGKTGINCFVLITGYFMCRSKISLRKWLKLYLAYLFWGIFFLFTFSFIGYSSFSASDILWKFIPLRNLHDGFFSCFMLYYLLIPFLNILIQNMNKKQHTILMILLLFIFTGTDLLPNSDITFNYITWFSVVHIIGAYIRLYRYRFYENTTLLFISTILLITIASIDIVLKQGYYGRVADSNAIFAVLISVSSFLLFKNISVPQSKIINTIASASFGVLLIHANSDAMRQWLWKDTIDCAGHYSSTLFYPIGCVLLIYIVCTVLELFRIKTIEAPLINYTEKACNCVWSKINAKLLTK